MLHQQFGVNSTAVNRAVLYIGTTDLIPSILSRNDLSLSEHVHET